MAGSTLQVLAQRLGALRLDLDSDFLVGFPEDLDSSDSPNLVGVLIDLEQLTLVPKRMGPCHRNRCSRGFFDNTFLTLAFSGDTRCAGEVLPLQDSLIVLPFQEAHSVADYIYLSRVEREAWLHRQIISAGSGYYFCGPHSSPCT